MGGDNSSRSAEPLTNAEFADAVAQGMDSVAHAVERQVQASRDELVTGEREVRLASVKVTGARMAESHVEEAALEWFDSLGYATAYGPDISPGGSFIERDSYAAVFLLGRLQGAIARLNPHIPYTAYDDAVRKLTRRESPLLVLDNRRLHRLLVDGVEVEYTGSDGNIVGDRLRLIDFADAANNDWLAVNQFTVVEGDRKRRPDVVVFVNGIPLGVIELKNVADENATIWSAFNQIQTYKEQIPALFVSNEALVISDGLEARLGSLTSDRERFQPWRTIAGEELAPAGLPQLQVVIEGVFEKRRFLDFVRFFVVYEDDGAQVLKKIAAVAGYGRQLPDGVPALNLFLDHTRKWRLAYIVEDVRSRQTSKASPAKPEIPLVFDYVIDALNGAVVAKLPRTPAVTASAPDELGQMKTFNIEINGRKRVMRDAGLNIDTHDFHYRDPLEYKLPGEMAAERKLRAHRWSPAAVSAHSNTVVVATFLRDVLKRNNIDNMGGPVVSTVKCLVKQAEQPPAGSKVWLNAFWDGAQMLYGQDRINGKLRSMASSLSVVAHELFHGVTGNTARLLYLGESGALNESYSDIFGTIIANNAQPDIAKWDWQIGCGMAARDMQDPMQHHQPKLMKDFMHAPLDPEHDSGAVHVNSGIHNYAAFNVMTAKVGRAFVFKPAQLAAMFYVALTQQLSRQSTFSDSQRGVVLMTRSLFRMLPQSQIDLRRFRIAGEHATEQMNHLCPRIDIVIDALFQGQRFVMHEGAVHDEELLQR